MLLGIAAAHATQAPLDYVAALLALIGATTAHVGVNALNEYFDFQSCLDLHTERTPLLLGLAVLAA